MYGPEKSVNERVVRNAHLMYLFLVRGFGVMGIFLHDEQKRDVIWPETL